MSDIASDFGDDLASFVLEDDPDSRQAEKAVCASVRMKRRVHGCLSITHATLVSSASRVTRGCGTRGRSP